MSHSNRPDRDAGDVTTRFLQGVLFLLPALIVIPLAAFIAFGVAGEDGDGMRAIEWLFFGSLLAWLLFDDAVDRLRKRVQNARVFKGRLGRVFTPRRLKNLFSAVLLAPVFGFCLVEPEANGWAAIRQWAGGTVLLLPIYIALNELFDAIGRLWKRWRARR